MRLSLSKHIILKAVLFGAALFFFGCMEEQTEKLGELKTDFSSRTIVDAFLQQQDSGKVIMELKAPLIEEYEFVDSPYTLMRKGLFVKFWNSNSPKENTLRADWAMIKDKQKFYEGRGNVVMVNNDGDTLKTNHIFWNSNNKRIWTKDTVVIHRKDGTYNRALHGLEASQDFKEFTFFKNSGVLFVEEDKMERQNPKLSNQKDSQDSVQNGKFERLEIPSAKPNE